MKETTQQYVERIKSYMEGHKPLEVQAETAAALERLTGSVPAGKLGRSPAPGQWSVAQILAHLAQGEIVIGWRLRSVLGQPGGAIAGYDQNAWAAAGFYDNREPAESLELFRVLRKANLALLRSLKPEQWQLHGIHAERGRETIEQIATLVAGHDLNHLQQIERMLKPGSQKTPAA